MINKKKKGTGSSQDYSPEQEQLRDLIGLGEFSARKSYYPELQKKIDELKDEKNRYQRIFSDALSGIFQAELDGGIIVANPSMVRLCGYTSNEHLLSISDIGKQLFADQEEKDKLIKKLIDEKSAIGFETQFRKNDGMIIYVSLNASILTTSAGEYLECFVQDITDRKLAEEKLNQSHKMDAIGQLAGGIAHDFNNILGGIIGAAQLLKSPKRNLDEKGIKHVNMILQAATRAADLTSKLLAFGRKGKIASTAINIHSTVDDTVAILNGAIDKKISISVKKCAKNHTIVGDSSGLQNVLMNMGINASQAMPEGGEILIETKNIKFNKTYCDASPFEIEPDEYIEIKIQDTGCGISSENLQKIFEPFFTTKKQGKGTGLGLAAVYGTVQDHHGAINVYSEVGTGTVFHIYLPCSEKSVQSRQIDAKVIDGSGQILLVDDEEIIRITGKHMLEEMGYSVLLAKNGREAVEIFQERNKSIDLVIMDMIMPEMNGHEAFFKLKKIDKNCKVVISSGFPKNERLDELMKSGLYGFIHKPYRDFELSQLLSKVLKT